MEESEGRSIRDKNGNFQLLTDRKTFRLSPTTSHTYDKQVCAKSGISKDNCTTPSHHITATPHRHVYMAD